MQLAGGSSSEDIIQHNHILLKIFNLSSKMPLSKKLGNDNIADLKKEFLALDSDGDGTITVEELGNILRSMRVKLKVSESEIKRVLRDIDKDGDGTIDLNEYFKNMQGKTNKHLIHRALVMRSTVRKQFEKFDKDGSGYISLEEIRQIFEEKSGGTVTMEQVQEIVKGVDKNSDGQINYDEFVVMMSK